MFHLSAVFPFLIIYLDHRLEDARAHEQAEDFTRQEKILKLISTELTRNTTRVVEMAVKAEVQNSVLPALENITRTEVRAALNENVGTKLGQYVQQVSFPWQSFCAKSHSIFSEPSD